MSCMVLCLWVGVWVGGGSKLIGFWQMFIMPGFGESYGSVNRRISTYSSLFVGYVTIK